jgi:hypothetical protein
MFDQTMVDLPSDAGTSNTFYDADSALLSLITNLNLYDVENQSQSDPDPGESPPSSLIQQGSTIVLFSLISYVGSTASDELLTDQKSLFALLSVAVLVSFFLEIIKTLFVLSATLNKNFNLYFGADAVQAVLLMSWAGLFYHLDIGKNWSPVGYLAAVSVPGIALQLANNIIFAPCAHKHLPLNGFVNQWLFPQNQFDGQHTGRWYNHFALHLARYLILMSAMLAGSELFAQIPVSKTESVGGALVVLFQLCGAKAGAAIYASALLFNEILGTTFFLGTSWFKDIHPSFFTRLVTLVAMAGSFEGLASVVPFLKEETLGVLFLSATVTFFADLAVQYSVGPRFDKPVNRVVASVTNSVIEISRPYVEGALAKCGFCAHSDYQQVAKSQRSDDSVNFGVMFI